MKIFTEKKAGEFLEKNNFEILERKFITRKRQLKKIKFPCAIKVFGKNIIHKKKIGGVYLNIKTLEKTQEVFDTLKKIKGAKGIIAQEMLKGKELFLGIKHTTDFEHTIVFGKGGSKVEKEKDVEFRIYPINQIQALDLIKNTKIGKKLNQKEIEISIKYLMKLNELIKK
jgi:acyl-CoA synthetase (NDP forming)